SVRRVADAAQDEVPLLRIGYKILDAPDTDAALDLSAVLPHFRDHGRCLRRLADDRPATGLERLHVVLEEVRTPIERPQLRGEVRVGGIDARFWSQIGEQRVPV